MQREFSFQGFPDAMAGPLLVGRLNKLLDALRRALPGAKWHERGDSSTAITVDLSIADVTQVTLSANTTITLDMSPRAGTVAFVELVQDATGSRTVAWTNAKWAGGSAPVITATASKKDLIQFVRTNVTSSPWVGWRVVANYS